MTVLKTHQCTRCRVTTDLIAGAPLWASEGK